MKPAKTIISIFFFLFIGVALPYPVYADSTPPETEIYFTPVDPDGNNNWYTQPVDIKLVATDLESGVASINYKLDDNDWEQEEFLDTLNLIQNSSFETGNYWWISKWDHPYYPWWKASLRQSFWIYKFGNRSARIFIYSNGWYYWTNEDYYAVTEPFKVYSVRAWVKTLDFWGTGAYYKVWAKSSSGDDLLLAESDHISGSADWTSLDTSFYMPEGYDGVYLQLGGEGFGFVWWDGVDIHEDLEASYDLSVAADGEHSLWYYSIDYAEPPNVEDTHGPVDFKIDTEVPTDWRDFDTSQGPGYNDHTFDVSITVSDYTSGIDTSSGVYAYSTDGGASWSEWLPVDEYDPNVDGSQDIRVTAKAVDFENSDWHINKIIQFEISDMAGLTSFSPLQTINAPWLKTAGGDIYSRAAIDFGAAAPEPNATDLVVSSSSIDGITTGSDWIISDYFVQDKLSYVEWLPSEEPTPLSDVGDALPTESGIYIVESDFTLRGDTIPNNLKDIQNLAVTLFVDGDLTIDKDLELHETSGIVFIVSADVKIKHNVERIDGSFLADGEFDTKYSSGSTKQLTINGLLAADSYVFGRSLQHTENQVTPAELINYEPKYIFLLRDQVGEVVYTWKEKK